MLAPHTNDEQTTAHSQVVAKRPQGRAIELVRADSGKGRVLYVKDILELIRHAKSAWWVRNSFAPEYRFKVGRSPAWWENDALSWLQAQGAR